MHANVASTALFVALTFALTWVLWFGAAALPQRDANIGRALLFLPGTVAPAFVALWLSYRSGDLPLLLGRLVQWRVAARWYAFAAGYMAVAKLSAAVMFRLLEGAWPTFGTTPIAILLLATAISTPVQAGEELGWRGYALPRLGAAIGFPAAGLVLGVIWAAWHMPLFFIANTDLTSQSLLAFVLAVTALSVAMTWLFTNINGALVPILVMHAAVNNTTGIVPTAEPIAPGVFSVHASTMGWLTIAALWVGAVYFYVRIPKANKNVVVRESN